MVNFYVVPEWFVGLDIILELAFAIITLLVAFYSFKVYRLSGKNQSKIFALAFVFFSIAYFIESFINFAILSTLGKTMCNIAKLQGISFLNLIGIYFYMLFFVTGLVLLSYITLKIESPKTGVLLLLISLFSIIISMNKLYWFYFLSSLLLVFIVAHYTTNFLKNRSVKTFLVLTAFVFLLFGQIHFIFSVNHSLFYAIGHFFELFAYVLILINLSMILKNDKKTK